MSDDDLQESVAAKTHSKSAIAQLLENNIQNLPYFEQNILYYGPLYMGMNSALSGIFTNSLYRRVLNITQGSLASGLPMAVFPFVSTCVFYSAAVTAPLLSGEPQCPGCVLLRGALVGVVGGLYPFMVALPLNMSLACRFNTAPMPEKGNRLRFCIDLSRPVMRKAKPALILQVFFSMFLSSRTFESYLKLCEVALGSRNAGLQN
ncbi:transmembrane protein 126A [Nerophis ophidion]|uniref:transmembrane protein 126A n=1 Tax=Nerophis ophidion TaxID=159077 RepID=UPI002ADFB0C3|nr:transmembrane protein 126A [Nerophis ophidion]